jgi:hypothetical protein
MLTFKELSWSYHAQVQREERILNILMSIGFGEIYQLKEDFVPGRTRAFTTTGCILILENKTVVTAFLANYDQMTEYFDGKVPYEIRKAVTHSHKVYMRYAGRSK